MKDFINTAREIFCGKEYFKTHEMAKDYDVRPHLKEDSIYFADRGFKVSMMYDDYFSKWSGIHSDKYVSCDLYYFYILPCLNRKDFWSAYTDKNLFSVLLNKIKQPKTLLKRRNGLFYDGNDDLISREKALGICLAAENKIGFVIKPTVDTANGVGVSLFNNSTAEIINHQFETVGGGVNFIVQYKVSQCADMSRLNPMSLNCCRIHSYRGTDGRIRILKHATFLRIGGKGAVIDNMSSGGGACRVFDNGSISDVLVRYNTLEIGSVEKVYGIKDFIVPGLEKMNDMVLRAHESLPFFDFIGWDVALDENGDPVLIEYNVVPNCVGPQQITGPLFGDVIDEVMDRVSCVRKHKEILEVNDFRPGFKNWLQIG